MRKYKKKVVIGDCKLYLADCRDILWMFDDIDAVITSPPYDNIRTYEGHADVDTFDVIKQISKLLVRGGVCMWNVRDQTVNGSETGTSFRQALYAMECGLLLHDTMIYCKEGITFPNSNRYHPCFEYMFCFSNGAPKYFNGIKDWKNKTSGKMKTSDTVRDRHGNLVPRNRIGEYIPPISLRRNWWIVQTNQGSLHRHAASSSDALFHSA